MVVLSLLGPGVAGEDGSWVWVIGIALFSGLPIGSFDSEELFGLRDIVDDEWSALGDEGSVSVIAAFTVIIDGITNSAKHHTRLTAPYIYCREDGGIVEFW